MMLNKDFALIDSEGYYRYPYIVTPRDKNQNPGYECSPGLKRVPVSRRLHVANIEEVIVGVILNKWKVRVKRDLSEVPSSVSAKEAGARFDEDEFLEYWVSPRYRHLVRDASKQPVQYPYSRRTSSEIAINSEGDEISGRLPHLADDKLESGVDEEIDPITLRAADAEIDADPRCKGVSETERERLVKARIGQGEYRKGVLELWNHRCALTGLPVETALVASHAKPWSVSENNERVNPYNGLLLAASVDRLFDRGFISFSDDGEVLLGPQVTEADLALIGVSQGVRLSDCLSGQHKPFLQAHRKLFGFE